MKKLIVCLVVLCVTIFGATTTPSSPAEASSLYYSYAQRIPGAAGSIQIKCHNAAGWTNLPVGTHSRTYCGSNGWVDSIRNPTTGALYAKEIGGTGRVISYGFNYQGALAGGYWEVYLSNFCGGCGGGKIVK